MIRAFYGLTRNPFDLRELELLPQQQEIHNTLKVHCQQGGLCLVLGVPGTGKSVIKQSLQRLPENQHLVACVGRTLHTYVNTVKILCEAFRVEFETSAFKCERRLIEQAFSLNHAGKSLTTILDDAHLMDLANCAFPHSGCISSRTLPNCHPICGRCLHREFGKRRYLAPRSRMIYRTPLPRSSPRRYNGDFSGGPPVGDQCWFSRDDGEWNAIAERLKQTPCPHCSRVGPLIRHGFLYGFDDSNPTGKTRRAHRVFCSNRNARPGCGRTFTVWLADKIRRLSLTTTALWQFLQRAAANGILDAIRARDGQRSDRTWQRVWKRFNLCQSKIRTALFGRCPPPDLPPQPPQRPAAQVVAHLQAAFPDSHCPITAFQHSLRTFFV